MGNLVLDMRLAALVAVLLASVAVPAAGGVTTLTRASWDETLAEHSAVLVYFYTPSCKHCREFKPKFLEAAAALAAEANLFVAQVDGNENQGLCEDYDVTGFPSVLLFKEGVADPILYVDKHDSEHLVEFVKDEMRPSSVSVRNQTALLAAADVSALRQRLMVVAVLSDRQTLEADAFREAAVQLRRELSFGHCYDDGCSEVIEYLGLGGADGIAIVDALNGDAIVSARVSSTQNATELVIWLRENKFPLLSELIPSNDKAYRNQPLPVALLLVDGLDPAAALKAQLRAVAAAGTPRQLLSTFADAPEVSLDRFNLSDATLPALVVCKFGTRQYYPLILAAAVQPDMIEQHVAGVLDGSARPLMRTAAREPESVRGVRRLVGTNFEDIVNNESKDVLVMVYAEWCAHSKDFMPSYQKLARAVRFVPTVQIAKIDMAANDIVADGWIVEGYPAMLLVQARTNRVVKYNGERDFGLLLKWLQENAAIPFDYDPLEVNFMGHVEGVTNLGDSVRQILQKNRELEKEVQQLRAQIAALPKVAPNCTQETSHGTANRHQEL